MKYIKNVYAQAFAVAVVLTGVSYIVGVLAGWITEVNYLEAFAVFTSYACTYLCVKEKRFNYPIGALSTAAYCVLFFQQGLIASAILNLYLTPSLIYGWFRWGRDSAPRPVRHVELKWVPVYLGVTAIAYFGAVTLAGAFGGAFAPLDAIILVGTILAQFLLDNKRIETWMIWAVVNVVAIYTYFSADLHLAGFQYVFFLANTLYGWFEWKRSMNGLDRLV